MTFMLFLHWLGGQKRRHKILSQFVNNHFFFLLQCTNSLYLTQHHIFQGMGSNCLP